MITASRGTALLALLILSGCGGMTRTVGVFPAAMDDLGQKSEALRGDRQSDRPQNPAP